MSGPFWTDCRDDSCPKPIEAEEFLPKPIPAEKHHLFGAPSNPGVDLYRAARIGRRIRDWTMAIIGIACVLASMAVLAGVTL